MVKKQKNKRKQDREASPLCAIDIGSSGIRAMACTENPDGTLHILGEEMLTKYGAVERGIIVQKTEVATLIRRLLLLLGNRIGVKEPIDSVFLTVGGKLLQLTQVTVKRDLISKNYISDKLLQAMQDECRTKIEDRYSSMAVLSAEPVKYLLDGVEQTDVPSTTQKTKFIEIVYNVFVGKIETRDHTKGSFDRANISIEQQWVRPDALLTALADGRDMDEGCAIIDFGAQTTTMSVYKNDRFLYTRVVPFGSYDINLNIQAQRVSFDIAERLKTQFGYADENLVEDDRTLAVKSTEGNMVKIKTSMLARTIQMKLFEAVNPLMQDLKQYEGQISTVYITGGACKLQGIQEYLQTMTSIPVEYGTHAAWLEMTADEDYYDPQNAALVGTLALAAEYRKDFPDADPVATPPFMKAWKAIENTTLSIFTDENNG